MVIAVFIRRKKKEKVPVSNVSSAQSKFSHIISQTKSWFDWNEEPIHHIMILDYVIQVLKIELQSILLSDILQSPMQFDENHDFKNIIPIPSESIKQTDKKLIDFSKDIVWVLPWREQSMVNSIFSVYTRKYKYIHSNVRAFYYKGLDVTVVWNGRHHASVGIVKRNGIIEAQSVNVEPLFSTLTTDGAFWYDCGKQIQEVLDYRIAAIYELSKMKIELLKEYGDSTISQDSPSYYAKMYLELKKKDEFFDKFYDILSELSFHRMENHRLKTLLEENHIPY